MLVTIEKEELNSVLVVCCGVDCLNHKERVLGAAPDESVCIQMIRVLY